MVAWGVEVPPYGDLSVCLSLSPCEPLGSERRSGGVFRASAPEGAQGQAADP